MTLRGTYCDRSTLKTALGIASTDTASDAELLRILQDVSRFIDDYCHRHFYVELATRYFTARYSDALEVPDLLAITTLKTDDDGDRTYETTWTATDYDLLAGKDYNRWPKTRIEVTPNGSYSFPGWSSYSYSYQAPGIHKTTAGRKAVEIAGQWGHGDGESGTPYIDSTTTTNEALDASETGVDVVSGAALAVGQTILIESEQMYITAISSNTLTVERGVNGTTAATHDTGKTVYIYRYPGNIVETCLLLAAENFRLKDSPLGIAASPEVGGMMVQPSVWGIARSRLSGYRNVTGA